MKLVIKKRDPGAPLPAVEEIVTEARSGALDAKVLKEIDGHPNVLIPWFLIVTYAKRVHRLDLVSEATYRVLVTGIVALWDQIDHRHKHLIRLEDLRRGQFHLTARDYPSIVRSATQMLAKLHLGVKIDIDWRTSGV